MNSLKPRFLMLAMLALFAGLVGCSSERSDILGPDMNDKAPAGYDRARSASASACSRKSTAGV